MFAQCSHVHVIVRVRSIRVLLSYSLRTFVLHLFVPHRDAQRTHVRIQRHVHLFQTVDSTPIRWLELSMFHICWWCVGGLRLYCCCCCCKAIPPMRTRLRAYARRHRRRRSHRHRYTYHTDTHTHTHTQHEVSLLPVKSHPYKTLM